jgi:hypothetical protein
VQENQDFFSSGSAVLVGLEQWYLYNTRTVFKSQLCALFSRSDRIVQAITKPPREQKTLPVLSSFGPVRQLCRSEATVSELLSLLLVSQARHPSPTCFPQGRNGCMSSPSSHEAMILLRKSDRGVLRPADLLGRASDRCHTLRNERIPGLP